MVVLLTMKPNGIWFPSITRVKLLFISSSVAFKSCSDKTTSLFIEFINKLDALSEQQLNATEEEINNNLTRVIDGNQITFGFIVNNTTTSDKKNKIN
jgi:hypothetical protein